MSDHITFVDNSTVSTNLVPAAWYNGVNNLTYQGKNPSFVTSTGSANAQIVTLPTSKMSALAAGQSITFLAGFSNSGATTLTVIGLVTTGAIAVRSGAAALIGGEIIAGAVVTVTYANSVWNITAGSALRSFNTATTFNEDVTFNAEVDWGASANLSGDVDFGSTGMTLLEYINSLNTATAGTGTCVGGIGFNNVGTPDSIYDWTATSLVYIKPSDDSIFVSNSPSALSVNIGTAGPIINGRDQAAAFTVSTFIHFYGIAKDDGTEAGLVSASATSPTLPTGYTRFAYCATVLLSGAGALIKTYLRSDTMYYAALVNTLTNGTATVETAVDCSGRVPAIASKFALTYGLTFTTSGGGVVQIVSQIRVFSGSELANTTITLSGLANSTEMNMSPGPLTFIPNVGQSIYYLSTVTNGSSPKFSFAIGNYTIPNGG